MFQIKHGAAGWRAFLKKWVALFVLCALPLAFPCLSQAQTPMADRDGNGLIEIDSLLMLHNMRHNLAGTSYKASADSAGNSSGCPTTGGCVGYELARDLDFNVDDDGSTWSGSADEGYTLDPDDSQADYFPVENGAGGWLPIGDATRTFVAVFDGNSHSIRNLAIRRDQTLVGLFGAIGGGAAIRNLGLIDNLADSTDSSSETLGIGGLVGVQFTSSITASYATGPAAGGDGGSDAVGGLVGFQAGDALITASYATGAVSGGDGNGDVVGGLVGFQFGGSIMASYATGAVSGGDGNGDTVGGLVGFQFGGSITASYATGAAAGGDGDDDVAGGLVGAQFFGSITASYGFGSATGELVGDLEGGFVVGGLDGSPKPPGVSTAAQLTADNAVSSWNSADSNTLGAWDFGTEEQLPALNYANYDGAGAVFDCDPDRGHFPADACGTLLPGQQRDGTGTGPDSGLGPDPVPSPSPMADRDGDGLIEIDSLLMLHNMRHNLEGTSYKTGTASVGNSLGCPDTGCMGYELMEDLNFDTDDDGTWFRNVRGGYTLDPNDSNADYFLVENGAGGWLPIGGETNPFAAVFDGNGNSIRNLAIRRDQTYIGLFGRTGSDAAIRNLGLIDNLADYIGSSGGDIYIGGFVGLQRGGSITAGHATGDAVGGGGAHDRVGGLVGRQRGGSITASYATGVADGREGHEDSVGGLVGWQEDGLITASYATGAADGGDGGSDDVGGLVGSQSGGSITASYATGAAAGGDGSNDYVGGLVGRQRGGSITASYATGVAAGGDGGSDRVGRLVGFRSDGVIMASYGFGVAVGGTAGADGSPPPGVSTAAQLTEANAGPVWNDADGNTLGAWDFGTETQIPALNYADYDDAGAVFDCSRFPIGVCGTLLPRQVVVSAVGPSAVAFEATTTITGALVFGRVAIASWSWEQLQGPTIPLMGADTRTVTFKAPAAGALLLFKLTATDSGGDQYTDRIFFFLGASVDHDGDGLIDIENLTMLHNMRYNLAGTSYKDSADAFGDAYGCPVAGCRGYELIRDLDFDADNDGSTWSGTADTGYSLDLEDSQAVYFPVNSNGAGGWLPIGPFVAVFDGNGHTISNLAIRRNRISIGLFSVVGSGAAISNLGLIDNLADYTGSNINGGSIGGLAGVQSGGSITASYATGDAAGGDGDYDSVGGLVGSQGQGGSITASYATGAVDGGDGSSDDVGGLVGRQYGSITASYATGAAAGGDGDYDDVGGLVGRQYSAGSITASYATGTADGGDGGGDFVGGLVGFQGGSITASYGFGGATGESAGSDGTAKPRGVSTAAQLTADNAGSSWNRADRNTFGAWDFGTGAQIPALKYADYDGTRAVFDCGPNRGQFPADACGTLLPGQADVSASGPLAAEPGETVQLAGSLAFGRVTLGFWSWQQLEGPEVTLDDANARETSFTAPITRYPLVFKLTATDSEGRQHTDRISLNVMIEADSDEDGLIEIYSLLDLHNMRHNLEGTSYKASAASSGNSSGCPDMGCFGYELMQDLDFDVDGDGSTWQGDSDEGYRLDSRDSRADYFPVDEGGWLPIGDERNAFAAVFDGNGNAIRNLAIRRNQTYIGLFGVVGSGAAISNLGLIDNLADYTGTSNFSIYIGGLAGRQNGGSITASYATGAAAAGDGSYDRVGALVGLQDGGSITASYATGAAAGDGSYSIVGGLVGVQRGVITASYATGAVDGGAGNNDRVGGLVGWSGGTITASYATGDAAGGNGDDDTVGGLVGSQGEGGTITASYATGDAAGGNGDDDTVGGLVGSQGEGGTITASYGFGLAVMEEIKGSAGSTKPPGVDTAAQLTADNAGSSWNDAGSNTLDAWDFGTETQIPALKYADYDDAGAAFDCGPNRGQFPADVCGTLLPSQADVSASGSSAAEPGENVRLAGSLAFGRVTIEAWNWRQLEGPEVTLSDGNARETTFMASATGRFVFELTATDSDGHQYTDRISLVVADEIADRDGDGLIEINSLAMLHNMRHNLGGTSYKTGTASVGNSAGCPDTGCTGYELMQDLDFDANNDGSTWSGNGDEGYSLDSGDSQADYFPVVSGAGGWLPIGDERNTFVAVFDGNNHTISNLAIRRDQTYVGLFGRTGSGAAIRNLGLIDNLADYTGSSGGGIYIGGLVGSQYQGSITASYATGAAAGGDGDYDYVGGLVGRQDGGSIMASYATGAAAGGDGSNDYVGGLVGWQYGAQITRYGGSITASYATGAAAGGDGNHDYVGGLVGWQYRGSITASYATGAADGGDGNYDNVGGLVGSQGGTTFGPGGTITASYATGAAAGGDGGSDDVGGLVGSQYYSSITASYATGAAAGGAGGDYVGGLVGRQDRGSITASSYGFGRATGGRGSAGSDGSRKPAGVSTAAQLTAADAGVIWNSFDNNTLDVWDFGTDEQLPALKYADYDGAGAAFDCGPNRGQFPADVCGTLLPGQADVSASGSSVAEPGENVRLAGSLAFGRITIEAWSWRQLQGPEVILSDDNARETTFMASATGRFVFELTATGSDGHQYTDRISLVVVDEIADRDGDGLIEINSLAMLHNMRHNLGGTSYKTGTASVGNSAGCPDTGCMGYELMQDLDFDANNDGSTWSGNGDEGYSLDSGDSQADYFPVVSGAGGWLPIGNETNPFAAVFDGNGHSIRNLAVRRDQTYVGLFGRTRSGAAIRNLGLIDNLADYTGSSDGNIYIGGLVGSQGGSITASYATGAAAGGDGHGDRVGGLVGYQYYGDITASYATGVAAGGDGHDDSVGGLVGSQNGGMITASYATGAADGGNGNNDRVGGLVGRQFDSSITASYATGSAAGGGGNSDSVGGLVGLQQDGGSSITASYATGAAAGGDGSNDYVGGLVGVQQEFGSITASYGFGGVMGEESEGSDGSRKPAGVSTAAQLTAADAGVIWNSFDNNTLDVWDFGTDEQLPALKYADYDGAGAAFDCGPNRGQFPADVCGTLLPGQADVSASGSVQLVAGENVRLAGSLAFGRVTIEAWSWRQLEGPEVTLSDDNARETTFMASATGRFVFELTATDSDGHQYTDRISLVVFDEIADRDGGTPEPSGPEPSGPEPSGPEPSGPEGSDDGGGGGSLGPWALAALVLLLLLGWRRRRRGFGSCFINQGGAQPCSFSGRLRHLLARSMRLGGGRLRPRQKTALARRVAGNDTSPRALLKGAPSALKSALACPLRCVLGNDSSSFLLASGK